MEYFFFNKYWNTFCLGETTSIIQKVGYTHNFIFELVYFLRMTITLTAGSGRKCKDIFAIHLTKGFDFVVVA